MYTDYTSLCGPLVPSCLHSFTLTVCNRQNIDLEGNPFHISVYLCALLFTFILVENCKLFKLKCQLFQTRMNGFHASFLQLRPDIKIAPRKLPSEPNGHQLHKLQCKRGVRQSASHHGENGSHSIPTFSLEYSSSFLSASNHGENGSHSYHILTFSLEYSSSLLTASHRGEADSSLFALIYVKFL